MNDLLLECQKNYHALNEGNEAENIDISCNNIQWHLTNRNNLTSDVMPINNLQFLYIALKFKNAYLISKNESPK